MLDVGGWPSQGTSSVRTWWKPSSQSSAVHTPPGSQLWCGKGLVVLARPCLGDEGIPGAEVWRGLGNGENWAGRGQSTMWRLWVELAFGFNQYLRRNGFTLENGWH